MFCPGCGLEEKNANQFCRACGADMRVVRTALERPDTITASAESAREEIGRAIATKIRETQSTYDLKKVAEDVLPEIEKFLESPAEKRMRRIRTGTIISFIGLGATVAFTLISMLVKEDLLIVAGMGVVCLFIGLSFFVNGLLFTVPKRSLENRSEEADNQRALDVADPQTTNELVLPENRSLFSSVTENTTKHLKDKQPIPRN
jgi:uncharacterized Zn finger protein (UPF0148 family)